MTDCKCEIRSVQDLLLEETEIKGLRIPAYQRPYQWQTKNVNDLLQDMCKAVELHEKHTNFKYRLGTIILHKNEENENKETGLTYDIVDGQQRCITLALIWHALLEEEGETSIPLLEKEGNFNKESISNMRANYQFIKTQKEYIGVLKEKEVFKSVFEVVVITVSNVNAAFQLFDSQNTRGKSLWPHDLLKAYHLREIKENFYQKIAVQNWEGEKSEELHYLFNDYLFPILKWSRKEKTVPFTSRQIDVYKGVKQSDSYAYAQWAFKALPFYQIAAPVIAGKPFFDMIAYYNTMVSFVKKEADAFLEKQKKLIYNDKEIDWKDSRLAYVKQLFYAVCLHYYDKFSERDKSILTHLFKWVYMLRVDRRTLLWASVNKYAVGEGDTTNKIDMFYQISIARMPRDILNLSVVALTNQDNKEIQAAQKKWKMQ